MQLACINSVSPIMVRAFTVRFVLICYSVIALCGQGLHAWIEHDDCHADHEGSIVSAGDGLFSADQFVVQAPDNCSHHDCEHCAVCQHHSLGQIFVATPPLETALAVCELLSPQAPEAVVSTAHFSPAQPRAPPSVS
jgi:hypothetical protein